MTFFRKFLTIAFSGGDLFLHIVIHIYPIAKLYSSPCLNGHIRYFSFDARLRRTEIFAQCAILSILHTHQFGMVKTEIRNTKQQKDQEL